MNRKKRPDFLKALCILTFTGSSIAFVTYFFASIFFEKTTALIIKYSSWSSADQISPLFFTALMVLYAGSLIGAIRIWKGHKNGFYLYCIAQVIILLLPVFLINQQAFSVTNAIFTTVFIVGYGWNLKWLR